MQMLGSCLNKMKELKIGLKHANSFMINKSIKRQYNNRTNQKKKDTQQLLYAKMTKNGPIIGVIGALMF